jgi:hypothetical protein
VSATFAEWVEAVFDHPVGGPGWYWADDFGERWNSLALSDALTVAYLTRLFRTPGCLAAYSLDQVGQAIWFLMGEASPAQPSHVLVKSDVPFEARAACIRAMTDFFRDFVAPAAPGPADTDEDAFHIACYMWWDIFPSWGGPQAGEPALHDVCLTVMGEILQLRSELCRLSALHGLNHWHLHHASAVEGIIDRFLGQATDLTPRIREYVPMARKGIAQ